MKPLYLDSIIHCSNCLSLQVTPWSDWSPCSRSCGQARKERRREIKLNAQNGGKPCPRRLVQRRRCKENPPCGKQAALGRLFISFPGVFPLHDALFRDGPSPATNGAFASEGTKGHGYSSNYRSNYKKHKHYHHQSPHHEQ